ncbi:MAG: hypothetical protein A3F31_01785 [Candidatus Levybacteria bacterium RIFCSPHIGHO2_12_FULL_38_12]|nr:MAG: hypothetical protein A3F31_01785 [Candidatus Levybacteria bacterium RIFCSPHIGHO2_12_FULL_38_12]
MCGRPSFDGKTHPGCKTRYAIDGVFSALKYKGIVKKLVYQFKYKPFLSDLKSVLSDFLYESLIQNENFMTTMQQFNNVTIFFVPIPLHSSRFKQRGYNHAEILAEELGKKFDIPVANLLERTKQTRSQFGLKRDERKENLKNAFSYSSLHTLSSRAKRGNLLPQEITSSGSTSLTIPRNYSTTVFLIDDILTTGSTLLEAANILKRHGTKHVWGITLARD